MTLAHRPSLPSSWQAVIDFDGTISRGDTTDRVLQRFAESGWEAIEAEWSAGRIGSRECMARQVALLRVSPDVFDTFVEGLEIDWNFAAFVRLCERRGIPVTVVSDGLDRTIRRLLKRAGLGKLPVLANHLESIGGDRWRLSSPHTDPAGGCVSGTCKCRIASNLPHPLTLLVGDGRSDFCLAGQADMVFAKNSLIRHCGENGIPHQPFSDFSEAVGLLEAVLAAAPAPGLANELKDTIDG